MTPEERSTERIRDWLARTTLDSREAGQGLDDLVGKIAETPQRRRPWTAARSALRRGWTLVPAWVLLAGAVGAAAVVATLTIDADPRTIVVAQDGSGDATTVAGGVAMARDGDTVLVRPGTYVERIAIGADIDLRGDGPRETVVIQASGDPADTRDGTPPRATLTYRDASGSLASLTVINASRGRAISVEAGSAPIISNVIIDASVDWMAEDAAVWWSAGADGVLRDSTVTGMLGMEGAGTAPLIERNRLHRTCIEISPDHEAHVDQLRPVLRENAIGGCPTGVAIRVKGGSPVMEGNDVQLEGGTALSLTGSGGTIRGNTFHDSGAGIAIANPRGAVLVEDNLLRDNAVGIGVFGSADGVTIEGNRLEGNAVGLNLTSPQDPVLAGNRLCENAADLRVVPMDRPRPSPIGTADCGIDPSPSPA